MIINCHQMISKTVLSLQKSKCSGWILPWAQFSRSLVLSRIQQALSSGWATHVDLIPRVSVLFSHCAIYHTILIRDLEWNNYAPRLLPLLHLPFKGNVYTSLSHLKKKRDQGRDLFQILFSSNIFGRWATAATQAALPSTAFTAKDVHAHQKHRTLPFQSCWYMERYER